MHLLQKGFISWTHTSLRKDHATVPSVPVKEHLTSKMTSKLTIMDISYHNGDCSSIYQNECTMESPFITALVRYSLHTIKLNDFKCIIQMIFSEHSCATISTNQF